MNKTFYARFALPILMLVFFAVPFGVRGARLAFSTMKNDIKDWLPDSFAETKDLEWFRDNFLGEQFILLTWPGCRADDTRYKLMVEKLRHETALPAIVAKADPAKDADPAAAPDLSDPDVAAAETAEHDAVLERERLRNRDLGDRLGLTTTGDYFQNWGGRDEKWLVGDKDQWYFLTPAGELYKWDGGSNLLGWASRRLTRLLTGKNKATGTLEAQVGAAPAGDQLNEYYNDPRKITARLFKTVTTGPEVLERIAGEESGPWPGKDYSPEEKRAIALDRLRGALFGPDGQQTCMIVTLSDAGRRDLKRVLGRPLMGRPAGRLLQMADEAGLAHDDLRMGGPPVDNVAIDEEGSITLVRLIGWSLLLGVGLAYLSFRSVKITMMVFFVGGVSAMLSLSFLWYCNDTVDAIVMSMPSLVYVLGLTGAIHMLTYYHHHVREKGLAGAPEATIAHTWRPLLLGQATSALGLLSLLTSELLPIRKFGWYSALGTLATLIVMYLFLPAALQLWPVKDTRRNANDPAADDDWLQKLTGGFWRGFSGAVVRNHYWIAPAMFVLMCVMFYGTTKLKTNVHLLKMFDADAKIIRDYAWLEQNLGRLVPMELVVRVAPDVSAPLTRPAGEKTDSDAVKETSAAQQLVQYNFLERMELAAQVQRAIELEFGPDGQNILGQGMSAVTFAPPLPAPGGYSFRSIRGVFNRKLEQHRDEILHSDYLRVDKDPSHAGAELWRVSLRLGALNNVDYGEFVSDLQSVVEPALAACRHREALLRQLAAARGEEGLVGARVAVIGVSSPGKYVPAAPSGKPIDIAERTKIRTVAATAADLATVARDEQHSYERQQERVFSQTLHDLLVNRGFKTTANAKTRLDFLDAAALAPEGKSLSADELAKKLASYDCVVFAQPVAACDLAMVTRHAKQLVDASDFRFDPAGKAPTAACRDDHVQAIYTGVVPIVYKAQRSLLDSLVSSTNWAFCSIALCMMLLLRSGKFRLTTLLNCRGGLVAMLPNVFPLIMVFGALGYLGVEIDIGSMMTASIAIGVAVDDTIHYLEWFRAGMRRGLSRREAIITGYEHFGPAIIETMLIGGLGLSVFALSTFTPTQRFGLMMLSMLTVGVVGEVIWFPALLAGPLGKYLEPKMDHAAPAAEGVVAPAIVPAATHPHIEPPHTGRNVVRRDRAH